MKEQEDMMFGFYQARTFSEDRRPHLLAEANRERLADIARAGNEKPSRISKVLNALQRIVVHQNMPVEQKTSSVGEAIASATNS